MELRVYETHNIWNIQNVEHTGYKHLTGVEHTEYGTYKI
jgi:hypothetical protein